MKALFNGIGVAAASGLLMGAAMKPQLALDDRPEGPQMFAGWSGARSTGPFDPGASFADYRGAIPDYVAGTDWVRPAASPPEPGPRLGPIAEETADAPAPQILFAETRYEGLPSEPVLYPSLNGGAAYASPVGATPAGKEADAG